ncbi:Htur_1727 family rSAM-partnered candidate RiPP [Halorussus marinus]|uniref:Htur_1727 family rSAM-partnered candidate RiPP n=1 Tax=Halorussus marinus TaxID=2505976 RepID=UPI00106E0574|nr:Htur_1727 family rSAM-partnered candidate RiPP [Halorussus marinus]
MVEKARRAKVGPARADPDRTWEVFARDEAGDDPRYVGRVRAGDADAAHAEASRLFCWYAAEVWVVPSAAIRTYAVDAAGESESALPETGDEGRTHEL